MYDEAYNKEIEIQSNEDAVSSISENNPEVNCNQQTLIKQFLKSKELEYKKETNYESFQGALGDFNSPESILYTENIDENSSTLGSTVNAGTECARKERKRKKKKTKAQKRKKLTGSDKIEGGKDPKKIKRKKQFEHVDKNEVGKNPRKKTETKKSNFSKRKTPDVKKNFILKNKKMIKEIKQRKNDFHSTRSELFNQKMISRGVSNKANVFSGGPLVVNTKYVNTTNHASPSNKRKSTKKNTNSQLPEGSASCVTPNRCRFNCVDENEAEKIERATESGTEDQTLRFAGEDVEPKTLPGEMLSDTKKEILNENVTSQGREIKEDFVLNKTNQNGPRETRRACQNPILREATAIGKEKQRGLRNQSGTLVDNLVRGYNGPIAFKSHLKEDYGGEYRASCTQTANTATSGSLHNGTQDKRLETGMIDEAPREKIKIASNSISQSQDNRPGVKYRSKQSNLMSLRQQNTRPTTADSTCRHQSNECGRGAKFAGNTVCKHQSTGCSNRPGNEHANEGKNRGMGRYSTTLNARGDPTKIEGVRCEEALESPECQSFSLPLRERHQSFIRGSGVPDDTLKVGSNEQRYKPLNETGCYRGDGVRGLQEQNLFNFRRQQKNCSDETPNLVGEYIKDRLANGSGRKRCLSTLSTGLGRKEGFNTIPFVVGKSANTSHNIGINIQRTLSMFKMCNVPTPRLDEMLAIVPKDPATTRDEDTGSCCTMALPLCPALSQQHAENEDSENPWSPRDDFSANCTCFPRKCVDYNEVFEPILRKECCPSLSPSLSRYLNEVLSLCYVQSRNSIERVPQTQSPKFHGWILGQKNIFFLL
ncbi:hypothetical protein AAG570_010344 [Ranatra chinensis]|uniref:Uncharacterized protein n=1 Tax=Ranatra chinensis TaxID=642074 RepID=A0ABD0ZAL7_9HEMI